MKLPLNLKPNCPALICATAIGLLWGCSATMESRLNDATTFSPQTSAEGRGIAYFLPLVKLRITATRTTTLTNEDTGEPIILKSTNTARTEVTQWFRTNVLTRASVNTNAQFDSVTGTIRSWTNDPAPNIATNGIEIVNAENQTVTTRSTPGTRLVTRTQAVYNVVVDEIMERDPHHLCLYQVKPSIWANDQMQLVVTNGIVQYIAMTNDDRTLKALENLASAAAKLFTSGILPLGLKPTEETVQVIFDPFDSTACWNASNKLSAIGVTLNLDEFVKYPPAPKNEVRSVNGIFYRPFLPYTIGWKVEDKENSQTVHVPNAAPILHWDLDRAHFVKQVAAVSFANGEPTTVSFDKPSQVEAITQFPLNIVNQIAGLPTNILQLKFDIATKRTQLLTESNSLFAATMQYLTNQAALEQRVHALESGRTTAAPSAPPTGGTNQPVVH